MLLPVVLPFLFLVLPWSGVRGVAVEKGSGQEKVPCTKVWTPDVATLSFFSQAGGLRNEVHVDLGFKKVSTITTDFDESKPYKRVRQTDLLPADEIKMRSAFESLCLDGSVAAAGPPPGGFWYFEVHYRRGAQSPRILSRNEGVTKGTAYFVLSEPQTRTLLDFVTSIAPPIK